MKETKEIRVMKEQVRRVDCIKDELFKIVGELEEAGFTQKAKSLHTLIGKLEYWQHTGEAAKV